jgi:hypothetical protein
VIDMHLAELNIAEWKIDPQSEAAQPFLRAIDKVNAVADRSPGFVWRLQDDGGNAIEIDHPWSDQDVIVNMSVWEDAHALENYVWNTVHRAIYRRRDEWFTHMRMAHFVMWWVEPGHMSDTELRPSSALTICTIMATPTLPSAGITCRM